MKDAPLADPVRAIMDANNTQNRPNSRFDASAPVDEGTAPSTFSGFQELPKQFAALKEYASYYVTAKIDALKITGRNIGIFAGLGIVGLIAFGTVVSTAVVLLMVGLSIAIGWMFGHQYDYAWVGALIVGVLVLGGMAAAVIFGMRWITNTSRASLVKKYENRQREQRVNLGRDVRGREADDLEQQQQQPVGGR